MTMSSAKKKKSISDQINEILKPKELVEETNESEARYEEFTEHGDIDNQLSDIRKQTAKSLSELDSKYQGKVVSRKELELDGSGEDDDSDEESQNEENYATDSDEDVEEEEEENSDESASGSKDSDGSGSEDDDGDDCDISQFTKPSPGAPASSSAIPTQDKTEILKNFSLSDEIKKGVCVQNQLKLWEKLLEVRIKSQKMLITANSLPDFDAHLELSSIDPSFAEKVDSACDGIHGLLDNLLELQSALVNKFPESKEVFPSTKRKKNQNGTTSVLKRSKLAEYSDRIEENHKQYGSFRNQVLQKWHERTKTAKDSKNPAANLNIMAKIENSLLGKNEMIRRTQLYRGDYDVYGIDKSKVLEGNADGTSTELQLPEIFDDSEFYHQLLRELIEYKSNTDENQTEITKKFIELQKVRSKMKKKVDTRASKGRKIRYIVHNKLVNYMPPKDTSDYTDEARSELYSSLFGMANQGEKL